MYDVSPCVHFSVCLLILRCQNQECNGRGIEHFQKPGNICNTGHRYSIKFVVRQCQSIFDEIFEFTPQGRPAVADEYVGSDSLRPVLSLGSPRNMRSGLSSQRGKFFAFLNWVSNCPHLCLNRDMRWNLETSRESQRVARDFLTGHTRLNHLLRRHDSQALSFGPDFLKKFVREIGKNGCQDRQDL